MKSSDAPNHKSRLTGRASLHILFLLTLSLALGLPAAVGSASPLTENSTQPGELIDKLEPPAECARCHTEPVRDWTGGMMGNDFRDPSFLAMLSIAEQDVPGVGDYCLRCHAAGWFEGKSEPPGGDFLGRTFAPPPKIDQESVPLCDLCHRLERVGMRPARYDGKMRAEGEGSVYIRPDDPWKGGKHPLTPLHKEGELCGSCHDVSNPTVVGANDPTQVHPLERTYTEWKYSHFGENGITCQNCHPPMKFPGAQTWLLYPGLAFLYGDVDAGWANAGYPMPPDRSGALMAGRERNETFMKRAADIQIRSGRINPGTAATVSVKIINNTGHKLPTGFAEGRQMWVHLRVTDKTGRLVFEDGRLDEDGKLVRTDQTKVYEHKQGIGKEETFRFAANDTVLKDNRIPPVGFKKAAYEAEGAYIVGADYQDGQNWDETDYRFDLPPDVVGPLSVRVTLKYETYSAEYMGWLLEADKTLGANHGGPAAATPDGSRTWAETTYKIWEQAAKGRPVVMNSETVIVPVEVAGRAPALYAGAGTAGLVLIVALLALVRFSAKRRPQPLSGYSE